MKKLIVALLALAAALVAHPAAQVGVGSVTVLVLGLAFPSASYATPVFSFSPIDAGGTATDALGINASGQIVGAVYDNFYCDEIYGCYPTSSATSISETGFSDQARPREPFLFKELPDQQQIGCRLLTTPPSSATGV